MVTGFATPKNEENKSAEVIEESNPSTIEENPADI